MHRHGNDSEFHRSIMNARLPKYRMDRNRQTMVTDASATTHTIAGVAGSVGASTGAARFEQPLLEDVLYDDAAAEAERERLEGKSSDADIGHQLAAWRLQVRSIFFPRAHVLAQQAEKQSGETVAVLDQSTDWFELLSLILTLTNIVAVAVEDPTMPDEHPTKLALDKFDTFFSLFYFFEMTIRIISFGLREFWSDAFNRLDAVVVAFGLTSLALKLTSRRLANITFVRALRVLRPLRTMTQFRQTRMTVASVIGSFRELLDVWLLFMVFFGVLCVLAIDPFRGVLRNHCFNELYFSVFSNVPPLTDNITANNSAYVNAVAELQDAVIDAHDPRDLFARFKTTQDWREFIWNTSAKYDRELDPVGYGCHGEVDTELGLTQTNSDCENRHCSNREGTGRFCPVGYECVKSTNPNYGFLGFDNLFLSALTTFVLLTTSFWVDIYTMMYDSSTGLAGLYCIFAVIVGRYFVVSIIIAIVTDRFREKHRQQQLMIQEQEDAAARASKRIRVKSLIETSFEAVQRYFDRLRNLEEIEIHHDFASALEEDVLVRRTKRDWDAFRFVDEDLYDTQASMIRRSASMAMGPSMSGSASPTGGGGGGGGGNIRKPSEGSKLTNRRGSVVTDQAVQQQQQQQQQQQLLLSSTAGAAAAAAGDDDKHYVLDDAARRRRWFAREVVLKKWFLIARIIISCATLGYLATEYEGIEANGALERGRYYLALGILGTWSIELFLRALSRRWLLLVTDAYFMGEFFCALALYLSLVANFGTKFGSLSEAFFLGRISVFMSESYRITPLYRWIRIIVAAFRSSIVLILIILLALFLIACAGMQVFGAQFCSLDAAKKMKKAQQILAIQAGTCDRPRGNFDSFGNAMVASFQLLTGDKWERIMFAGMQSIWMRNKTPWSQGILAGMISLVFVATFIVLNYLFSNLLIAILLNSRAVNEEELRREAVRIQREVHYEKLLARRQLQLEAGLYDVAAVASALFNFKEFFKGATNQSRKIAELLLSTRVAGRLAYLRSLHLFSTVHVACIGLVTVGLVLSQPLTPPDTSKHYLGLALIHISTACFFARLVCEIIVESYKMRLRRIQKRKRKANDLFDFTNEEEDAALASIGSNDREAAKDAAVSRVDDEDAPFIERYAVVFYFARSNWHVFEAILTVAGIVFGGMRVFFHTYNIVVYAMSCILCFRPLGFLEKATGLQGVLRDIRHMLRNLACILSLLLVFFIFYSLLGVQLLRGRMSVCSNSSIVHAANCTLAGHSWGPVALNFDDLGAASYTLYAIATFSDWTDIYYQASLAGHSPFNAFFVNVYFFFFIIAGGLFAQALITMMLIDTFEVRRLGGTERVSKQDQARAITSERFSVQQKLVAAIVPREIADMRRRALQKLFGAGASGAGAGSGGGGGGDGGAGAGAGAAGGDKDAAAVDHSSEAVQGFGQLGLRMTQSTWFRNLVVTIVFLSFCVSASYRYPMSSFWTGINYWADVVFTILFSIELVLYLFLQTVCVDLPKGTKWWKRLPLRVWNGCRVHFSSKWNWFDAIIVVLSVLGLVLEKYAERWAWTKNFRALRALRLLRLVKNNPRISMMVSRLGGAIRQLFSVTIIFAFAFGCFGLLGMRLFAHVKHDSTLISDRVGFGSFVASQLMMMRVATLNRWPATMIALSITAESGGNCDPNIGECGNRIVARTFMILTTIVFGFVLSNMFVAVLVDTYMSKRLEHQVLSQCALTAREVREFAEKFITWPTMDPVFFTIPSEHVVPFLRHLRRGAKRGGGGNKKNADAGRGQQQGGGGASGGAGAGGKDGGKDGGKSSTGDSGDAAGKGGGSAGGGGTGGAGGVADDDGDDDGRPSRVHPFALPVCELRWRQPQWDLMAVQQLGLKEYSPGLIDYWSLINALCDLRFVREVANVNVNATTGAASTVKAGILERSKEKMLKRKFLLKVPARQQQLAQKRKNKKSAGSKRKVDDDLDDNYDEEDEEINPVIDDGWDTPFSAQPRVLTEVYAISRLREILLMMPKWRGFMLESATLEGGGADGTAGGKPTSAAAAAAAAAVAAAGAGSGVAGGVDVTVVGGNAGIQDGLFQDTSMQIDASDSSPMLQQVSSTFLPM